MDPVYELPKPVTQCGVCFRSRRFTFVIAHETTPLLVVKRGRRYWTHVTELTRICGPACAEHFAAHHDAPMYDKRGFEITEWLRGWRQRMDERIAA
jgi:hypothetical protein